MCSILFDPRDHTYRRQSDGMLYMPVTHFTKQFSPPFNPAHHSKKSAAEKCIGAKKYKILYDDWCADKKSHTLMPAYITYLEQHVPNWESYEREQERVLGTYDEKRDKGATGGTEMHDWEEKSAIMRGVEINEADGLEYPVMPHGKQADGSNRNVVDKLCDLSPGCYLELMIWYDFPEPVWSISMGCWICGICGQEDKVFILEDAMVDMADYKSSKNKKLDDYGIRYKNYGFEYMLYPFNRRRNHDKNKYSLQLNTYAWMMHQAHGLRPNSILILHKGQIIEVHYEPSLTSSAINMAFSMGL